MLIKNLINPLINQKGQALLIIVLVMVVALTVGLSVASRTIINLRNTQEQVSSQKALSAAEAGVQQALKNSANVAGNFAGNTTYNTTIGQVLGTSPFLLNGGNFLPKNDAIYVWITPYSTISANLWQTPWNGNLTLYWGDTSGECNNAAIEVAVISGDRSNPVLTRYAFDPCPARRGNNNFQAATAGLTTIAGKGLSYRSVISITNGLLVRVNPIYSSSYVGAGGSVALPPQGSIITSTGISDSTTQRKVTVYQGYPEIPAEVFPYTLFSP